MVQSPGNFLHEKNFPVVFPSGDGGRWHSRTVRLLFQPSPRRATSGRLCVPRDLSTIDSPDGDRERVHFRTGARYLASGYSERICYYGMVVHGISQTAQTAYLTYGQPIG